MIAKLVLGQQVGTSACVMNNRAPILVTFPRYARQGLRDGWASGAGTEKKL
jgi:hypothetical protein